MDEPIQPYRVPEPPAPLPPAAALPTPRERAAFAYVQRWSRVEAARGCAVVLCAVVLIVLSATAPRSRLFLLAILGPVSLAMVSLAWSTLRDRFALELEPHSERVRVLRLSRVPFGGFLVTDVVPLSAVQDVVDEASHVRGRPGRLSLALLDGIDGSASLLELGRLIDKGEPAALRHWLATARTVAQKEREGGERHHGPLPPGPPA